MFTVSDVRVALRQRLTHDLNSLDRGDLHQEAVQDIVTDVFLKMGVDSGPYAAVAREVLYEVVGFGPLLPLMADPEVSEVMVNGPEAIFVERNGKTEQTAIRFESPRHLRYVVRRLLHLAPGKRLDETSPMVDISLPDGSRVNIIVPPAAVGGPQLTIRKWNRGLEDFDSLIAAGTLDERLASFLSAAVLARQTLLVSGAAGAGKSTLVEILGHSIQSDDRLVVIEDTYELKFLQPNTVRLLSREANVEGSGAITVSQLFRNSLRMRPNRIILGEVRGAEAYDFLQATTSGHRGSLGIIHASNPTEALLRLENLASLSGLSVPRGILRQQVAHGIDLVVQIDQGVDGVRRITAISEVRGLVDEQIETVELFSFVPLGLEDGRLRGDFRATGAVPKMLEDLQFAGLDIDASMFSSNPSSS